MKNPIETLNNALSLLGVTAAAAAANGVFSIGSKLSWPSAVTFAAVTASVPLAKILFDDILRAVVASSIPLRRLILGRYNIEGTYIEICSVGKDIFAVGILEIEHVSGQISVHGNNYSCDGILNYHWASVPGLVKIEWPFLYHAYQSSPHDAREKLRGLAEMKFSTPQGSKRSRSYTGSFVHTETGHHVGFEGWLLEDPEELAAIHNPEKLRLLFERRLSKSGFKPCEPAAQ